MTEAKSADERRPFVKDLRTLHRYARSHVPGEKYSADALSIAMAGLGIGLSSDEIGHALERLELEYDVVLVERRPTHGPRGKEVKADPAIPEHLDHPEDWDAFPSPPFASTRKSRLTLDGAIFAELASLVAGYEFIAREATARIAPKGEGVKARPDVFDRKAVLGWLRVERRRLQGVVEAVRGPDGSVFQLRVEDTEAGLDITPMDLRIMELAPPRTLPYPEEEPQEP
jgi:hypothetical protein